MRQAFSTFALAASLFLAAAPALHADISVSRSDSDWEVTADGDRLSDVLEAIQAEAGFRLVGADRLAANDPVTADLSGSLGDILARLLSGYDYALVYGETPESADELQRVVLLSGRSGEAPDENQRLRVERLPGDVSEEDGQRVSDLLQRQVQPLIDAENGEDGSTETPASTAVADAGSSTAPETTGGGSDYELDPETQAALAEATRRAQQDLQALVNALQAAEGNGDNEN